MTELAAGARCSFHEELLVGRNCSRSGGVGATWSDRRLRYFDRVAKPALYGAHYVHQLIGQLGLAIIIVTH